MKSYGYKGSFDFDKEKAVYLQEPLLLGTDDYADADNLYLDSVEIYVPCAANLTFYVGCLDQYSLFQKTSEFERTVHPGKNRLVFTNERIAVPAGYGIFVKWSAKYPVFSGATGQDAQTLVSFASECYQDAAGYSGHPLRPIPYCVPLRFSLAAGTSSKQNTPVNAATQTDAGLIAPDGIKYHLSVGSDGNLYTIRSIPRKVVVFGNSLTEGFGYGMAASDKFHDYFYYVEEYLKHNEPAVEVRRQCASPWEGMTTSESRRGEAEAMARSLDGNEDLLILQLSDNVNTPEKRTTFGGDAFTLLSLLRMTCPRARIIWVAAWFNANENYPILAPICAQLGIDMVDIRDLSLLAENKSAVGNQYILEDGNAAVITNSGVAMHPGNLGMKRIAERIIDLLESYR